MVHNKCFPSLQSMLRLRSKVAAASARHVGFSHIFLTASQYSYPFSERVGQIEDILRQVPLESPTHFDGFSSNDGVRPMR